MAGKPTKLEVIAGMLAMDLIALEVVLKDGRVEDCELGSLIETRDNLRFTLGQLERYGVTMLEGMCLLRYGEISPRTALRIVSRRSDVERTYGKSQPRLRIVGSNYRPDGPEAA